MIQKNDFVNIDYVGRINEEGDVIGKIFDLTDEALAKKENIYDDKTKYGPVTIIIGSGQLLPGVEEALVGKKAGEEFDVLVPPEKGFGKKNAKLFNIIPEKKFKERVVPGMKVPIQYEDGSVNIGEVRFVGSGRVTVDFNHPLAGKILNYHIKINKIVAEKNEQVLSLAKLYTGLEDKDFEIKIEEKKTIITSKKPLAENSKKAIEIDIKKYIKLEDVEFIEPENNEKSGVEVTKQDLDSNGDKNEKSAVSNKKN